MTDIKRLNKAFQDYLNSDLYKNLPKFRKLSDGQTTDVFYLDVARRVRMEYMGILNDRNEFSVYNSNGKGLVSATGGSIKDLVSGYGILNASTRLYAEYGTSKPLIVNTEEEIPIDLDDLLARLMIIQSWAGRVLIKSVLSDTDYTVYPITPKDYFVIRNIYNPFIIDSYVVYSIYEDKYMKVEIYSKDLIEYREYKIDNVNGKIIEEIKYSDDLTQNGMTTDGLGYIDNRQGWGVVEVQNIFGKSDYNEDLIKNVKEIIIGDTLTSQAFQKVANPLIQVPDSLIEVNKEGKATVRLDDRVVTLRPQDRDVKQVQLETKTLEWKEHRKQLVDDIYKQLGLNDLAFGISIDGAVASGEAKIRSLERILSTVNSKRDKCLKGITELLKNIHIKLYKKELEITIKGQDILTTTTSEKINMMTIALQNNLVSLANAVEFIGLHNDDLENELAEIKKDLSYQKKKLEFIQQLENISRDERLQKEIEDETEQLITELIGEDNE